MLGRDLSPGTTKMGGKWSNPLQRPHRRSGAQPHCGTTTSRATSKQQLRRNTTPVWMEACTAPVTKSDCHIGRYVTKSTRQPGTDHDTLFIPVHKVKIHLISWRYKAVYDKCSSYQPLNKMWDTICHETFALSVHLKSYRYSVSNTIIFYGVSYGCKRGMDKFPQI